MEERGIKSKCWRRRRKDLIYNFTWAAGNQFLNTAETIQIPASHTTGKTVLKHQRWTFALNLVMDTDTIVVCVWHD